MSLMPREDFDGLEGITHLAAGGEAPPLRRHHEAVEAFLANKAAGYDGRVRQYEVYRSAKESVAAFLGVETGDVAFLLNASDGVNMVATSLDWRPGDNVVVQQFEYPSVVYPWSRLRAAGVEVRTVPARGWAVRDADTIRAIDARTRVVSISQVSYLTGVRHDVSSIAEAAHAHGSLVVVDASHAAGVVPVDPSQADFLVSCAYKFMLGSHGVGICIWNRRRQPGFVPAAAGWSSAVSHAPPDSRSDFELKADAGRIETGNPSHISLHILNSSARYLHGIGVDRIEQHVLELGGVLRRGLVELGLDVMTPADPQQRAASVCFAIDDCHALRRQLRDAGVLVWAEEERIRLSLHGYTDDSDIARCLRAIKGALRR